MTPVTSVETFIVTLERETPYLGPLASNEKVNDRGYVVRQGNGTVYPVVDRSIIVRITAADGKVGWGETYGLCSPKATCEIINDLLAPVIIGADPEQVEAIWDDLYGLMRVRGCTGGFHVDAITAIDIALWDLRAQLRRTRLCDLLGETLHQSIAGYVSGLPKATLASRINAAKTMYDQGHRAFKFAAVVSREGIVEEMAALRGALGNEVELMVDLHWKFTVGEALQVIAALAPFRPHFVEAPVKPEDMFGLAEVACKSDVPIAAGEEWYTSYDVANRLDCGNIQFIQPEMGHTGVTQFLRIAKLANERGISIAPHATIGVGIFLAASLHVSATLPNLWKHEWQHSVFSRNLAHINSNMRYENNAYVLPTTLGLGAAPKPHLFDFAELVA